jgi:hypothetical protein
MFQLLLQSILVVERVKNCSLFYKISKDIPIGTHHNTCGLVNWDLVHKFERARRCEGLLTPLRSYQQIVEEEVIQLSL